MSFEILTRQPVKFYEKQGIKFFEDFQAVDKLKKPVKVFFDLDEDNVIKAKNFQDNESAYTISFNLPKKEMEGVTILAEPHKTGIGEILKLSALMEFKENMLNHFKVFSLKESIQFHTRYGFKLVSDDVEEILRYLKMVMKSKSSKYENYRYSANFYYPRIAGKVESDDKFLKQRACDVVSRYLQELSKDNVRVNPSDFKFSTHMMFTDWETQTNREFLNSLLDEHKINYKF